MVTKQRLSTEEILHLPAVVDIPTAGRALGLGRSKAYALARSGDFPCPVLRVGDTYHVPTAGILELLGIQARHETVPAADQADPVTTRTRQAALTERLARLSASVKRTTAAIRG